MPSTPNAKLPYPAGGDSPAGHQQIQALADAVDAALFQSGSRALQANGLSVPNNAAFPVTGGYVAVADDEGNGVLSYSAGVLTATRKCLVDVFAYVSWPASATGERRLDLTVAGDTYRQTSPAAPGTALMGQALAVPGIKLATGNTIQVTLFQNSGAAVTPFRHELRAIVRKYLP
jgi:hypothetical protein